uniref:Protein-L-isoaspartate O-methyltransferase n=1 Tax=Magnetococcus massalia (strain MO-1) TaxID=451514 RepID=A0A1S7LFG1_MAGMO|nr:Protein-L-isoaspartate(D-aspartate) O-methyltransferase [Candidatus Magnetococcus massalia]
MDFALARTNMVKSQVLPNDVLDESLLGSMMKVERENFVPQERRFMAYSDQAIPFAEGRRCLTPVQIGKLIEACKVPSGGKGLVVGAGSGYEAALLATMGLEVVALESDAALVEQGKQATEGMAVSWQQTEPADGYAAGAPYDVILVAGSMLEVSTTLADQLDAYGIMVSVVGAASSDVMQVIRIVGRTGVHHPEKLFETRVDPLPVAAGEEVFEL